MNSYDQTPGNLPLSFGLLAMCCGMPLLHWGKSRQKCRSPDNT